MSVLGTKRLFTSLSREGPVSGGIAAVQFAEIEDFKGPESVESRCGAVALGSVCLLPPLSSGGAQVT